jgi:ethanolamine ammonia-lyase large subunit
MLEATLHDIITTFGLEGSTRHCVLAHIDDQMKVRRGDHLEALKHHHVSEYTTPAAVNASQLAETTPSATLVPVAFQSLGGTTATNRVFGISVESLRNHLLGPNSPRAQYFETGQGSAVTNGSADGVDMVVCESRAHGLARALRNESGNWTIVNTVAGFIGPEVFANKNQLLRACLEDLLMGKLHGYVDSNIADASAICIPL